MYHILSCVEAAVDMQCKKCSVHYLTWHSKAQFFVGIACFTTGRLSACLLLQRSPLVSTGTLPRKGSLKAATEQLPSKQPLTSSLRVHKGCTRSLGDLKVSFSQYLNHIVLVMCSIISILNVWLFSK